MSRDTTEREVAGEVKADVKIGLQQPEKNVRQSKKWILVLIPVFFFIAGYFLYRAYFANKETTDDAQIDGHINPVSAKVPGNVISIDIKDNQFVQTGTVLVQIDPRDYLVAVEKAAADLAAAQSGAHAAGAQVPMISTTTNSQTSLAGAGLEQTEGAKAAAMKDVETARARLESMQARVKEIQAAYTKAMQDLERMKFLIQKDEISKQQYDAAVAAADAAKAAGDSARAGVDESARTIEAGEARVLQAEARIKEARANLQASQTGPRQIEISRSNAQTAAARMKQAEAVLRQAELNLEYTRIKAPIDGFVSQRRIELGQYVQTGQPLMALVPLHNVWVTANFKENQLKNMRPGQSATVSVDAYGGRKYEGHVESIAAATGARFSLLPPENATGNYVKVVQRVPVKILIERGEDSTHPLRPGLSVVATVSIKED
jgi:membrane fusion protein, multidrug efflux system